MGEIRTRRQDEGKGDKMSILLVHSERSVCESFELELLLFVLKRRREQRVNDIWMNRRGFSLQSQQSVCANHHSQSRWHCFCHGLCQQKVSGALFRSFRIFFPHLNHHRTFIDLTSIP